MVAPRVSVSLRIHSGDGVGVRLRTRASVVAPEAVGIRRGEQVADTEDLRFRGRVQLPE